MRLYITNIPSNSEKLTDGKFSLEFDAPAPSDNTNFAKTLREIADMLEAPVLEDKELF